MGQRIPSASSFNITQPASSPVPKAAAPSPKPYRPQSPPESPSPYPQTPNNPPAQRQASSPRSKTAPVRVCSSCSPPHKPASQTYPESPTSSAIASPSRAYSLKPPQTESFHDSCGYVPKPPAPPSAPAECYSTSLPCAAAPRPLASSIPPAHSAPQ